MKKNEVKLELGVAEDHVPAGGEIALEGGVSAGCEIAVSVRLTLHRGRDGARVGRPVPPSAIVLAPASKISPASEFIWPPAFRAPCETGGYVLRGLVHGADGAVVAEREVALTVLAKDGTRKG